MTDGKQGDADLSKFDWFLTRAAASSRSRILLAFNIYANKGRVAILERLQARGLTVLYSRDDVINQAVAGIPNTFGLSEAEIAAMPRFVQKYKCGSAGQIESAEPLCLNDDKFNPVCPNRLFETNWHPGWYVLQGRSIAFLRC